MSSRQLVAVCALAVVLAGTILGAHWYAMTVPPSHPDGTHPYARVYDPPHTKLERLLNIGDGQAFAALAQDPTLARPQVFDSMSPPATQRAEAAYRAQRPLFGWLAWAGSLGQADEVPLALAVLTTLGAGVLAVGAALAADRVGRRPDMAAIVIVAPGSLVVLSWSGPEALATGLALAGMALWPRSRRWAVVAFTVAVLGRETMLLVPLALAADELVRRRRPLPDVVPLAVPALVWGGWVSVVRLRLGSWPTAAGAGRLGAPLRGLAQAAGHWTSAEVLVAALGVALAGAALVRLPGPWSAVVLAHLGLVAFMGAAVWGRWEDFSRVLLPMYVIGAIALLPTAASEVGRRSSGSGADGLLHHASSVGRPLGR